MSLFHLLRNVSSNYLRFALAGLIGFVLTPILFHSLKADNYAVLVFALAMVAVLESLDLGLFSALVRFVSNLAAREKHIELRRLGSSVFYLLVSFGALGALAVTFLSPFLTRFFRVHSTGDTPGHVVVALVGLSLVFQLPSNSLRAFLEGCQDFHLANMVDTTTQLVRAALMLLLLWNGFGLLAIAAVFPVAALIRLLGMLAAARRASIAFCPRLTEVNLQSLRETRGFASLTFVEDNATRFFFLLDTFLAAKLLPLPQLAILAVVRRFPWALTELCWQTLSVTYPMISSAAARGDHKLMQKFLFISGRNLLALALPLAALLAVWAEVILRLWIGGEILGGVPVFRVFLVFAVAASLQEVSLTLLYGVGKIRFSTLLSVMMLAAAVGVGAWACSRGGLLGLAVALAAIQTTGTLLLFRQALQLAGVDLRLWIRKAVLPVFWAILPAGAWLGVSYRILPHNLSGLVASSVPGLLLFWGLFFRLVVGAEKQSLPMRVRRLLTEMD